MSDYKLRDAMQLAEKFVLDEKLQWPIDVIKIAESREINVQPMPVSTQGVSGMLISHGNAFAIGYATYINNPGFQRFSVAHELGHYFLPGHPAYLFSNGQNTHQSSAGFSSGDQIELEADHFATGLLMPSHLFKPQLGKYSDGLIAIEQLAKDFDTSLTASAIRYATLTDAAVAVVLTTGQTVNYCFSSNNLKKLKGYKHPSKGSLIPKKTLTRDFNIDKSNVLENRRADDSADLLGWFRCEEELDAYEEVIGLGAYGKTLTVITAEVDDD